MRVLGTTIPSGEQSAPVNIYIPANFSGRVTFTAAAGGSVISHAVTIHTASECQAIARETAFAERLRWIDCEQCFIRWLNDPGDMLVENHGELEFYRRPTGSNKAAAPPLNIRTLLQASPNEIESLRLNGQGELVGTLKQQKGFVGFLRDPSLDHKPMHDQSISNAHLVASNDLGLSVGFIDSEKGKTAIYFNGHSKIEIPIPGASWASAVAVNNLGHIAVNAGMKDGVRSFVMSNGKIEDVGDLGDPSVTITALSESGDIAGFAKTAKDASTHAFVGHREPSGHWRLTDIGGLPGFDEIHPTALNSSGLVVGFAATKKGTEAGSTRAFVYSPHTGLLDVSKIQPTTTAGSTLQAVTVNAAGQVLINEAVGGKTSSFILQSSKQK